MTDLRIALERLVAVVKSHNESPNGKLWTSVMSRTAEAEAALAGYTPQPPEPKPGSDYCARCESFTCVCGRDRSRADEPGEAAKGGGAEQTELEFLKERVRWLENDYYTKAAEAKSRVEADLAEARRRIELLTDGSTSCGKDMMRIAELEAALAKAEGERGAQDKYLLSAFRAWVRNDSLHHQENGTPYYYARALTWWELEAPKLRALVNPSTTRSARAEARSDNPWADNPNVCAECHHSDTSHSKGPCVECDCIVFIPPEPPQPGGFGPTDALRAEIVEALRAAGEGWADMVADRLERKG